MSGDVYQEYRRKRMAEVQNHIASIDLLPLLDPAFVSACESLNLYGRSQLG